MISWLILTAIQTSVILFAIYLVCFGGSIILSWYNMKFYEK
jgi:hypothetical protein